MGQEGHEATKGVGVIAVSAQPKTGTYEHRMEPDRALFLKIGRSWVPVLLRKPG
jgi:hypothetical protein